MYFTQMYEMPKHVPGLPLVPLNKYSDREKMIQFSSRRVWVHRTFLNAAVHLMG